MGLFVGDAHCHAHTCRTHTHAPEQQALYVTVKNSPEFSAFRKKDRFKKVEQIGREKQRWMEEEAFDEGIKNAFDFPGFVPAYVRPLFCRGVGPFRWAALSGDPEDIANMMLFLSSEHAHSVNGAIIPVYGKS